MIMDCQTTVRDQIFFIRLITYFDAKRYINKKENNAHTDTK